MRRASSSVVRSECRSSWKDSTSRSASPLDRVNRSSTMKRAAAAPSDAASRFSSRIRSSRSSGGVSSSGALVPRISPAMIAASGPPT